MSDQKDHPTLKAKKKKKYVPKMKRPYPKTRPVLKLKSNSAQDITKIQDPVSTPTVTPKISQCYEAGNLLKLEPMVCTCVGVNHGPDEYNLCFGPDDCESEDEYTSR